MRLDEFGGDGEAETGATLARHALERLEQMGARPIRHAGASVGYFDDRDRTFPSRRDHDLAGAAPFAFECLHGVAAEIGQNTEQLVAVGVDLERLLDVELPGDKFWPRQTERIADFIDEWGKRKAHAPRRHLLRLAEIERAGAKPDGAVERGDQLRHQPLHGRVLHRDQAVRKELRARQHVAQIVAYLAHGEPERGEPRLLREHIGELRLHGGELSLGGADLVTPLRWIDDPGWVLGALAEAHDVPCEFGHRLHQEGIKRKVDERGGDDGDQDRQPENVEPVPDHGCLQRPLAHDHFDELASGERGRAIWFSASFSQWRGAF